jgi:hypothetical protein
LWKLERADGLALDVRAELVPALAFLVLMFFVPESPRWLMKAGKAGSRPGRAGTHWLRRLCRQDIT